MNEGLGSAIIEGPGFGIIGYPGSAMYGVLGSGITEGSSSVMMGAPGSGTLGGPGHGMTEEDPGSGIPEGPADI